MRLRPVAPLLALLLLAPSCQTFRAFPDPAWALRGDWSGAAAVEAAGTPDEGPDPPQLTFRIVEAPALAGAGGTVVHLVWRAGGAEGPIRRQRLWVFRPDPKSGRTRLHVHTLLKPLPFATAPADSALFRTLTARDVASHPESCALTVRVTRNGFRARMPEACEISAPASDPMPLTAEVRLEGQRLTYSEAGMLPGTGPYIFTRRD